MNRVSRRSSLSREVACANGAYNPVCVVNDERFDCESRCRHYHCHATSSAVNRSVIRRRKCRESDRKFRRPPFPIFFILVIRLIIVKEHTVLRRGFRFLDLARALLARSSSLPSIPPTPSHPSSLFLSLPPSIDRARPWRNIEEPNRADVHACVRCNYRSCCH